MKKFLSIVFVALITVSCGGGYDRMAERDKIIDVHDEVMPKLGEVMNLRKQVLAKSQEANDEAAAADLRDLAAELEAARKGMMTWMNDWSKTSKEHVNGVTSEEAQKSYFAAEMKRITKVKEDINSAITSAKEVLK
ncbi:hypothetical protein [Roseivirga sp.]|uniref:hypothetical protein n=1 Tax=Roseivirga sp. TaxID=1964215 RepID=UPI003B8CAF6A